jgi:ABC-type multidrug transport system fused ATPase/permease subunit
LNADKILVLKNGELLDCGTDEELGARCEEYRNLRATASEILPFDSVDGRSI